MENTEPSELSPVSGPMERREETLIQSYVEDRFFVSTIHRRCSAAEVVNLWYYETIVWEWDYGTRQRGKMLDQRDSSAWRESAFQSHYEACREYAEKPRLSENGVSSSATSVSSPETSSPSPDKVSVEEEKKMPFMGFKGTPRQHMNSTVLVPEMTFHNI